MAGATRLELATFGVTGRRSNQIELRPRTRCGSHDMIITRQINYHYQDRFQALG